VNPFLLNDKLRVYYVYKRVYVIPTPPNGLIFQSPTYMSYTEVYYQWYRTWFDSYVRHACFYKLMIPLSEYVSQIIMELNLKCITVAYPVIDIVCTCIVIWTQESNTNTINILANLQTPDH